MPLLGRKVVNLVKPLTNVGATETIYTIPHTKEQFRSKADYDRRVAQYNDAVWTCQCSGHINLTHEDAYRSEQEKYKILEDQFPKYTEKVVLDIVHHSTDILDTLVDKAWTKIQQTFFVGETVMLKMKAQKKSIRGQVVQVNITDPVSPMKNGLPNGNCSSPSSDKENTTSGNNLNTDAESSADAETESGTPTKWVHPKVGTLAVGCENNVELLPYRYCLRLEEDDKVVSGVPAQDLQRVTRPPSKDLVKLYIRSFALRHGTQSNSPWVVHEDLVKHHQLKNKIPEVFLSPTKNQGNAAEGQSKKRKNSGSLSSKASKKAKLDTKSPKQTQLTLKSPVGTPRKRGRPPKSANSTPKTTPKKQTPRKANSSPRKTPTKRTPVKKTATNSTSSSSDDSESDSSDDDVALADIKDGKNSSSSTPKSKSGSPKKKSLADLKRKLEEDTPLSQLRTEPPVKLKLDGTPMKKRGRPPKPKDPNAEVKVPKKRGRPRKTDAEKAAGKSPKKATPKKQNMKQITLFDLKGKGRGKGKGGTPKSPAKSPRKQTPVKLPPMVTKLQRLFKNKEKSNKDKYAYYRLLNEVAEKLTKKQQAILPQDVKDVIMAKIAVVEEKKKLKKMTPEQREEYMKQKRRELAKKKLLEKRKVEDTHLDLQPLPLPKLVPTPDGIANELFGDIVMITEFINCYKGLLLPEDERVIDPDELMKSLAGGEEEFLYVAQVLQVLLKTLLQDGIAEDYKELGVALASVSITPYGSAELARLCLRERDEDSDEEKDDSDSEEEKDGNVDSVESELLDQLETTEMWGLQSEEKLSILQALCHRLLGSYSVQDYMSECQQTATDLWRRRVKEGMSKNEQKKLKKKKGESEERNGNSTEDEKKTGSGVTIKDFYGKVVDEEADDLASVVKRRRVMAAKAVEEKRRRDLEERARREKETEEQKKIKELENFEKEFQDGTLAARHVLRQSPIGTDRDHNRYWVFLGSAPGLFVEKGWAPPEMEYCVGPKKEDWEYSDSDSDSDSDYELTRGRKPREQDLKYEKTAPRVGQNLWFLYNNIFDIQSVMERLHAQGVRESNLLTNLKKIYPDIEAAFKKQNKLKEKEKDKEEVKPESPETEKVATTPVAAMTQDLLEMEMRLRGGGLGGVDNFTDWEKNILKAQTIQEFGALLIETQSFIPGKFLKGFLGPDGMFVKKAEVKKVTENEEGGEEDEEKVKEEDRHAGIERWKEAITTCPTLSRLHVLLTMLDSCVKWERSAENAKCKVCRKKGDELLLCDECNQPFHLYCLRPALLAVPEGEWFCPSCRPLAIRRNTRNKDYRKMAEGPSESEDDEEEVEDGSLHQNDQECTMCGGDEGLIYCSTCPSAFHLDCHQPPLRREPRSVWKCNQCITGVRIRRRGSRPQRSSRRRPAFTYEVSSSDEEEEEEEEEEQQQSEESENEESEEEQKPAPRPAQSRGRGRPRSINKIVEEEDDDALFQKQLKTIREILNRLSRNKHSWPFLDPVVKADVPDYYDIVKNPISLADMRMKLNDSDYHTPQEFADDIALLLDNANLYNKRDSDVGVCIEPFETLFLNLMNKNFPEVEFSRSLGPASGESSTVTSVNNHYSSDTENESDGEEEEDQDGDDDETEEDEENGEEEEEEEDGGENDEEQTGDEEDENGVLDGDEEEDMEEGEDEEGESESS